jgi:hypothetical protein
MMSNATILPAEDHENLSLSSVAPINQHVSQSQLLTKMYYPETLYPNSYSFFADRSDTISSKVRSPIATLSMEANDQYTSASADVSGHSNNLSTITKQGNTEIEIIDRPSKYPVSIPCVCHVL